MTSSAAGLGSRVTSSAAGLDSSDLVQQQAWTVVTSSAAGLGSSD